MKATCTGARLPVTLILGRAVTSSIYIRRTVQEEWRQLWTGFRDEVFQRHRSSCVSSSACVSRGGSPGRAQRSSESREEPEPRPIVPQGADVDDSVVDYLGVLEPTSTVASVIAQGCAEPTSMTRDDDHLVEGRDDDEFTDSMNALGLYLWRAVRAQERITQDRLLQDFPDLDGFIRHFAWPNMKRRAMSFVEQRAAWMLSPEGGGEGGTPWLLHSLILDYLSLIGISNLSEGSVLEGRSKKRGSRDPGNRSAELLSVSIAIFRRAFQSPSVFSRARKGPSRGASISRVDAIPC